MFLLENSMLSDSLLFFGVSFCSSVFVEGSSALIEDLGLAVKLTKAFSQVHENL